jgi:diphthamide synthase (EF-2-diphthine--ammonia ligase)
LSGSLTFYPFFSKDTNYYYKEGLTTMESVLVSWSGGKDSAIALATLDMKGIFPIWKRDTMELLNSLTASGFKAITACVDTNALDRQFVGRVIDEQFLSELPPTVDVCGENGEYHSFVYDGPIFKEKISYSLGEIILRDNRYCYCDLMPG